VRKSISGILNRRDRIVYGIGVLAGLCFVIFLPLFHPYPFSYILKAVPVTCLALIAWFNFTGRKRTLILLALIFCLAGDILLDLDREGNFKPALAAFLTGHLFYIFVFLHKREVVKKRIIYLGLSLVYLLVVGFILRNIDPEYYGPVYAYLVIIGAMWMASFLMTDFSLTINLGAMIFVFSDTVIAVNKFLQPIPNSTLFNIGLYFIAQYMIITGLIIRDRRTNPL
jgi:alkenylglycerophosphocholine/alkenylglycerophosphoethanolamine hydrolase